MYGGKSVWGERPFCAQGVCVRGGWKGRAGGGGGNGPPVQGSALGKEGRKYGVGMGENAFLCTKKGYYIPLIYWAEVPDACAVGGKTGVVRGFGE